MLMTSMLAFAVLPGKTTGLRRTVWLVLICGFLLMDVLLFSSNALKLFDGGWVPLLVGAALLTLRSEEHTSELQSLMRISYAVFCLKKKKQIRHKRINVLCTNMRHC